MKSVKHIRKAVKKQKKSSVAISYALSWDNMECVFSKGKSVYVFRGIKGEKSFLPSYLF